MKTTWMKLVVDSCAFLELSGDDVVSPDAAVAQLEAIAFTLKEELTAEERREFVNYIEELATQERAGGRDEARTTFLAQLPEALGLI